MGYNHEWDIAPLIVHVFSWIIHYLSNDCRRLHRYLSLVFFLAIIKPILNPLIIINH